MLLTRHSANSNTTYGPLSNVRGLQLSTAYHARPTEKKKKKRKSKPYSLLSSPPQHLPLCSVGPEHWIIRFPLPYGVSKKGSPWLRSKPQPLISNCFLNFVYFLGSIFSGARKNHSWQCWERGKDSNGHVRVGMGARGLNIQGVSHIPGALWCSALPPGSTFKDHFSWHLGDTSQQYARLKRVPVC